MSKIEVSELVNKYIIADSQSRLQLEHEVRLSSDMLNALKLYMNECAVLAVRQQDKAFIEFGLYANVLEGCSQDSRDNIVLLTKLYHSCLILQLDPENTFQSVLGKIDGEGADLISNFCKRVPIDKTLNSMGLKTSWTPNFNYIQIDLDEMLIEETVYSEPTDKILMATSSNKFVNRFRSWFQKLFGIAKK
jgi:hypothetical protein